MPNSDFMQDQNQPSVEKRDFKKQQNSQDNIAADQQLLTQSHTHIRDRNFLLKHNTSQARLYLQIFVASYLPLDPCAIATVSGSPS